MTIAIELRGVTPHSAVVLLERPQAGEPIRVTVETDRTTWKLVGEVIADGFGRTEATHVWGAFAASAHVQFAGPEDRAAFWPDAEAQTARVCQALSRTVRYLESLGLGQRDDSAAGEGRAALKRAGYDLVADRAREHGVDLEQLREIHRAPFPHGREVKR